MSPDKEQEIINLAPYMFRYDGWDNIQRCLLKFGFEVHDGWFDILKELVTNIAKIDIGKECRVFQVKEKYGGLRFYVDYMTDEISNLISYTERISEDTCEVCGKFGTLRTNGWYMCRCDGCEEKYNNAKK